MRKLSPRVSALSGTDKLRHCELKQYFLRYIVLFNKLVLTKDFPVCKIHYEAKGLIYRVSDL